jgi:outer membrane biosynthesis protein TonB
MAVSISALERKVRRQGILVSALVHTIFLLLLLLNIGNPPTPPPPPLEGVLVNLGLPNVGQGEENTPGPLVPTPAPAELEPEPTETKPALPETTPPPPTKTPPSRVETKPAVTTEDPTAVALREKQEKERKAKVESDRIAKEKVEAQRRVEDEEKRKKEAEAKATKDQIGGLFGGGGKGTGKGNTGKPGNQGDPNGDPNASALEGISTGRGSVSGNISKRNGQGPTITDKSFTATGTVVITVCIDSNGQITSTDFTQQGSTTSNGTLVNLALANARKWKFSTGSTDKECGKITYQFRAQ